MHCGYSNPSLQNSFICRYHTHQFISSDIPKIPIGVVRCVGITSAKVVAIIKAGFMRNFGKKFEENKDLIGQVLAYLLTALFMQKIITKT